VVLSVAAQLRDAGIDATKAASVGVLELKRDNLSSRHKRLIIAPAAVGCKRMSGSAAMMLSASHDWNRVS